MKTPTKTVEFLDLLKARRGWSSDYRLGKELGWKHSTISNYRAGRSAMSGPHALKIAHELDMPEAYVLACVEAEREPAAEVAKVWRALAETLSGVAGRAAAITLIGAACLLAGQKALAAPAVARTGADLTSTGANIHYANFKRLVGQVLEQLLGGLLTSFPALQIA